MSIVILIGDDQYGIEREITANHTQTNPYWRDFNFHRFDCTQLETALLCARSAVLGEGKKVVVIENCNFRQFGEPGLEMLECLADLPDTTHLIFTAPRIDKRLKVSKHLLKYSQLKEFFLIPPWRTDLIATSMMIVARHLNLRLSRETLNYLATAIGNNTARTASELQKLAVYSNGRQITLAQAQGLVPCTTQTNLELASALRQGMSDLGASLLHQLLGRGEHPLVIVSTLITQFRTWLWVKAALSKGITSNKEIADLAGVGNPKRIYYLREEVKGISLLSLKSALTELLDLEIALKRGAKADRMLPALLGIVQQTSDKKSSNK